MLAARVTGLFVTALTSILTAVAVSSITKKGNGINFMKQITLMALLLLTVAACIREPVEADVKNVILKASIARMYELQPDERKQLNNCCRYVGVAPKSRKEFKPSGGYWVRLSIDNKKLAHASLLNSCGVSLRPMQCEVLELNKKIAEAFNTNYYNAIYGKGLTRFILYDAAGNKIDKTAKHGGHSVASLKRDDGMDYFTIGPVNIKPSRVSIFISTSLQEFKFDIE